MHLESQSGGKFGFADGSVLLKQLPERVIMALNYLYPDKEYCNTSRRKEISENLRAIAVENFSWNKICVSLLQTLPHSQ